jgi:DNA-binding winged helix-turn-helix (wHTH) protein
LLILLATRRGDVVTRSEIQKCLWGDDRFVEFEHAINTAVRKIREALEDDPEKPVVIETLPRKGYRFIASVEVEEDPGQKPVERVEPPVKARREIALSPRTARPIFLFIQAGYLAMYCTALYHVGGLEGALATLGLEQISFGIPLIIVIAMCGIAVRLYLFSAIALDHPAAPEKFGRLFPVLLLLDGFWAASPLLAVRTIGYGIALAGVAGFAYLPFSQRTLIGAIYPAQKHLSG